MKRTFLMLLAGVCFSALAQNKDTRSVFPFTKLQTGGAVDVKLFRSDSNQVIIESSNDANDNVVIESQEGKLFISTKGTFNGPIKVKVAFKNIESLEANDASTIVSDDTLFSDKLDLKISGASKINANVKGSEIKSNVSGAGTLVLGGKVVAHKTDLSGAANLKANRLLTESTELDGSGAANAKIYASQKLKINATGANTIKYAGNPPDKNINRNAASDVKATDGDNDLADNGKRTGKDTTRLKLGDKHLYLFDDDEKKKPGSDRVTAGDTDDEFKHFSGIELGINGYLGPNGVIDLDKKYDYMEMDYGARSIYWGINLFEKDFHLYKNYINLCTGLGFGFNTYQFRNRISLNPDSSYTWYTNDSLIDYKKNKLKTSFVQAPLYFDFNFSKDPDKAFHVGLGVLFAYKMTSRTKQTYTINGQDYKEIRKDDYNINPFRYSAMLRVGYGHVTAFATYSLNTLFEYNRGPELYPFTCGVLIPFN
jgi:hypothetical protein